MTKFERIIDNKKILILALVLSIAVCLFRITWLFAFEKDGNHCDEAWSYGFACSYYDPYTYLTVNDDIYLTDATYKNINEWSKGEDYWNYLTISENERFCFRSVVYNKSGDNSPPLFELLLCFVCSLFPNTFSWWYGYSINFMSFIGISILLFKITGQLTDTKWLGVVTVLYYGFSLVGTNSTLYLRMYSLLTLFSLLLVYLMLRMFKKDFKGCLKESIFIVVTMILGGLTHFYFLVFAFLLSAFLCIGLLLRKEWKSVLTYAVPTLLGVILYFVIYPYSIKKMIMGTTMYEGGLHYKYSWNLRTTLNLILEETLGFHWYIDKLVMLWALFAVVLGAILWGMLFFVFRKDEWYKRFIRKINDKVKQFATLTYYTVRSQKSLVWIVLCLTVIGYWLIASKICYVEIMSDFSDRYFFNGMTVFVVLFVCLIYGIFSTMFRKKIVFMYLGIAVILIVSLVFQNYSKIPRYLFKTGDIPLKDVIDMVDSQNVILVWENPAQLEYYSLLFMEADKVLCICTSRDDTDIRGLMSELPDDEEAYLFFEKNAYVPDDNVIYEDGNRSFCVTGDMILRLLANKSESDVKKLLYESDDRLANMKYIQTWNNATTGIMDIYEVR